MDVRAVAEFAKIRGRIACGGHPKSGDFGYKKSACLLGLLLLAVLVGCGRGVDPTVVDPFERAHEKLRQIVSVDWDNVPLETALRELAERHDLPLDFDRSALEEAGVSLTEPVTLHVRNIRLRSVLHLLLDERGAPYAWRNDRLTITPRHDPAEFLVTRVYCVADITRAPQALDEEKLAGLIGKTVDVGNWGETLGAAAIRGQGRIDVLPGALLVQAHCGVHEQVDDLLDELRRPVDATEWLGGSSSAPSPRCSASPEAAVQRALDARVTVDVSRPPAVILREVADQHGINVVAVWPSATERGLAEAFQARPSRSADLPRVLRDVTLRTVLDLLLKPLDIGWTVRHDVLLLTSGYEVQNEFVKLHDLPAYVAHREFTCIPAGRDRLAASLTQAGHDELAAALRQWGRAVDPSLPNYDERANSRAAERLWRLLDAPVTIDYLDGSRNLIEALSEIQRRDGLPNVWVDEKELPQFVNLEEVKPRLRLSHIPLASALDLLLGRLGLDWYVREDVVVITSQPAASAAAVRTFYRLPPLSQRDRLTMSSIVTDHVRPDGWGPGVHALLDTKWHGNVLMASRSRSKQRDLRLFLQQWEASLDPGNEGKSLFAASPTEQRLLQAMNRRVSYSCKDRPCSSETAITELARRAGIENVAFDWLSEDEAASRFNTNRVAFDVIDTPLDQALRKAQVPYIEWTGEHDALLVTNTETRWLPTAFCRLPNELAAVVTAACPAAAGDLPGLREACLREGVGALSGIPRNDWAVGAAHVIRTLDRRSFVLVLTNTLDVHRTVRQALDKFMKNPRLPESVRLELQQFQAAERQRARSPPSGGSGGFFSVNSYVGSKP